MRADALPLHARVTHQLAHLQAHDAVGRAGGLLEDNAVGCLDGGLRSRGDSQTRYESQNPGAGSIC